MSDKFTKEQIERARGIANEYAKTQGKSDISEVVEPIKASLNGNDVQREMGRAQARLTVEQLTKLILRQELFKNPNPDYMDKVINQFNDGVVNEGNAKVYQFNNAMGVSDYKSGEFIPTALTTTNVDEHIIAMYQNNNQLTAQGYQFRKTLVYNEPQWIPYFKSGKLIEFIANLEANMYLSWKMYIFHKIMTLITTDGNIDKKVMGSADNAFDAWSKEFLPTVREMTTLSKSFNVNNANTNLMLTNPEDLLIFAHPKTIQTLESGIKSQLFNAKFLDLKGILGENNFINAGLQLNIGDESAKVDVQESYYIPETKIYVVSKHAIKHFTQIDRIETAFYGRNLATEFTMHKWGAIDFLPWGQGFVYENANLNTLP